MNSVHPVRSRSGGGFFLARGTITGDSMLPEFRRGDKIIIDPEVSAMFTLTKHERFAILLSYT